MVVAPGKKTVTKEPDLVFYVWWACVPTAHFRNILWVRRKNIGFFFFLTKRTRSPAWHLFVNQIWCNKYLSLHEWHSEWWYQWLLLGPLVFTMCSPWWLFIITIIFVLIYWDTQHSAVSNCTRWFEFPLRTVLLCCHLGHRSQSVCVILPHLWCRRTWKHIVGATLYLLTHYFVFKGCQFVILPWKACSPLFWYSN